jgi:hypothetical protein
MAEEEAGEPYVFGAISATPQSRALAR